MAAGAHADRDRNVLEIARLPDARIRPHEDRPRRDAIRVSHETSHAGAGIADRAPDAGALNHLGLVLGIGPVLRPLEILQILPARLRAAEGLPVELDVKAFGGEEAFLHGNEVIEPHALGRDLHAVQFSGHDASSRFGCFASLTPPPLAGEGREGACGSKTCPGDEDLSPLPSLRSAPPPQAGEKNYLAPSPPLSSMKRAISSTPLPRRKLLKMKGRAPRMRLVSRSMLSSEAPTWGARSILLITSKSERVMPGPPFDGIFSPAATSMT